MPLKQHFPVASAVIRALSGRWARRIYFAVFLLLLTITTVARLRTYLLGRKARAVLRAMAQIQIDQTTEEQLQRLIPDMKYVDWNYQDASRRNYWIEFTNEHDRTTSLLALASGDPDPSSLKSASAHFLGWIGYRYFSFEAHAMVEQGKVTHVSYGVADRWSAPRYPGMIGYVVSARSVHGFWYEHQYPISVSSESDLSPQYIPSTTKYGTTVIYTADAPREITDRIFRLDLRCFWGLRACDPDGHDIAPEIAHDAQRIQRQTDEQLVAGKCPDSIIEGRMKYLPDVAVSLMEVTGSRRTAVSEEGSQNEDWFTDYKLVETLRGWPVGPMNNIRYRRAVGSPEPPRFQRSNQVYPETRIGAQVLYFSYPRFNSCRFIRATPAAIEIIRRAPIPPKRPEDQVASGLQ